jgi:hypothetical protein
MKQKKNNTYWNKFSDKYTETGLVIELLSFQVPQPIFNGWQIPHNYHTSKVKSKSQCDLTVSWLVSLDVKPNLGPKA